MGKLKSLTRGLDPNCCSYSYCGNYETLEIHTLNERLAIDYFGGEALTQVRFSGKAKRMRRTIDGLGISTSWPTNAGEKVFHRFRQSLDDLDEGEVTIQQNIRPGKELQFYGVLSRLVNYYKSQR